MTYQPPTGAMPPPGPANSNNSVGATWPLGGLTTAVSILLGFAAVISLVAAFPFFDRADLLDTFQNRPASPPMISVVESADETIAGWLLIFGIVYVATGIVFIIWQHRHATNAVALHGPLGLGPGWAIGGWFIPLANFVLPFLQLSQSARASDPGLARGEPRGNGTLPPVQIAWAGTFIAAALTFAGATWGRPDPSGPIDDVSSTIGAFTAADRAAGIALLIYTVAGVFGILMVRTLARRQRQAIAQASQPLPTTGG